MDEKVRPAGAPTISQVSRAAGVSRSTVSRAFSRPELLSEATVKRVIEAAGALGYVPNHTARALSTGRYANVALILPDVANPFFPPLIHAAQAEADRSDLCVFLGNTDENAAQEDKLLDRFVGQVSGVVLVSSRLSDERIRHHAQRHLLVVVNRDIRGIPRVLIESGGGVRQAVRHLWTLGHRHIAYVSGPRQSWSNRRRRAAILKAGQELGLEVELVPTRVPSFEAGREAARAVAESGVTAAIAFDDLTAMGVMAGLNGRGMRVPEDLSVVGCDDVLAAAGYPALTTVSSRSAEAGRAAMSLLLDLLRTGPLGDVRYVLDTELVVRSSTAAPRDRG